MKTLESYIHNFFGYGNLHSDFWFIGKEEAGGTNKKDVETRINAWEERDEKPILDVKEFHLAINEKAHTDLFSNEGKKVQATWRGLIKLQCVIESSKLPSKEQIVTFQHHNLGQSNSNNCLLELFPLPAPSTSVYDYKSWFPDLEYLKSRKSYKTELQLGRTSALKDLIAKYKPKVVVFYSTDRAYIKHWHSISNTNFTSDFTITIKADKVMACVEKSNGTVYVICPHPVAHGVTNEFILNIGTKIAEVMRLDM